MTVQNNVNDARTRIAGNADRLAASGRISPQELATLKDNKVTQEDFAIAQKVQGNLMREVQAGGGSYRAYEGMFKEAGAVRDNLIDAAGLRPRLQELVQRETAGEKGGVLGTMASHARALGALIRELPAK